MLMVVPGGAAVEGGGVARGHGEVRERGNDGDKRCDDVEQTLRGRHVPRYEGKDARRENHESEGHP